MDAMAYLYPRNASCGGFWLFRHAWFGKDYNLASADPRTSFFFFLHLMFISHPDARNTLQTSSSSVAFIFQTREQSRISARPRAHPVPCSLYLYRPTSTLATRTGARARRYLHEPFLFLGAAAPIPRIQNRSLGKVRNRTASSSIMP